MSISAAFLVLDPPIDRLVQLVEYLRPIVSDVVIVVDDRTAVEAVDTMSTWLNVTLVPFHWVDDFSAARNVGLPHCQGDWVLHLDPDELPTVAMFDFIRTVDAGQQGDTPAPLGYLFFTQNYCDGRQGEEWEEHWHCRLFRREGSAWYKPVHEQVKLDGMEEANTRGTPRLVKAPREAFLIHAHMNNQANDETYARIEAGHVQ